MDKKIKYYCNSSNFKTKKTTKQQSQLESPESSQLEKITYRTYSKKNSKIKWSTLETDKFYNLLEMCGIDLSLIAKAFPDKNRSQIRNKLKQEESKNKEKVEKSLKNKKKFNMNEFENLFK